MLLSCAMGQKGPHRSIQDKTGPHGTIRDSTRPNGTIWDPTGPTKTIQYHNGYTLPYGVIQKWNLIRFDKEMNNIVIDLHYYQYHLKHPLSVGLRNQKVG